MVTVSRLCLIALAILSFTLTALPARAADVTDDRLLNADRDPPAPSRFSPVIKGTQV